MFLPDLSPFRYHRKPKCGKIDVLSVGWLDGELRFSKTVNDPGHWFKLKAILEMHIPVNLMRGEHVCELCGNTSGNGEYYAYNPRTNKIYAAPALILHYIQEHEYAPSEEFIEAVFHILLQRR